MPPRTRRSTPDPALLQRRRDDFGALVRRALDRAKLNGITIQQIEKEADVGSTTFYGWRDGRWTRDPVATIVYRFCDYLGVSRSDVNNALRWSEEPIARRSAPTPIVEDPDISLLQRKLNNPKVSTAQKLWIRRQIRALADEQGDEG